MPNPNCKARHLLQLQLRLSKEHRHGLIVDYKYKKLNYSQVKNPIDLLAVLVAVSYTYL